MKKRLLLACCILCSSFAFVQASIIYVAPTGSATNSGTSISAPTTLANAITAIAAGDTIYMRGGTYSLSTTIVIASTNNGTTSANKNVFAFPGEVPVLDFSSQAVADANRGIVLDGDFWHFIGITISGAGDNGMLLSGNNNTIERCIFTKNRDSGLQISRFSTDNTTISTWPSNNLVLNCESFDNEDPGDENADGFGAKLTCGTGNVFRGCISHNNIDDGWDFFTKPDTGPIGAVTLDSCISYGNGVLTNGTTSGSGDKNGFKLGGDGIAVAHIVRRCIAFNNGHHGFTDNDNPGAMQIFNNTSYNNTQSNFNFRTGSTSTFRNNLSYLAGSSDATNGTDVGTSNVWWKNNVSTNSGSLVVSAADFVSLTASVTKNADGSGTTGNFLALAASSDMINAGVTAAGINFSGSAPDIGAKEFGGSSSGGGTTTPPARDTLTTTVSPSGGGTITRSPDSASYVAGTTVTLTAHPATGFAFSNWGGAASGTSATTTVTLNSNATVTATFTAVSTGGGSTLLIDDAATTVSGYCGADGSRQSSFAGAFGGFYINLSNAASKGINYAVSVPSAGTYSFVWRYADGTLNGSYVARLLVNGTVAVSSISFPYTGAWTTWDTTAAVTATLSAGVNTIRLETIQSAEFGNIDWMQVTGNSPTAASCTAAIGSAVSSPLVTVTMPGTEAAKAGVYPNPAGNTATVAFTTAQVATVGIRLYSVNGALIKQLTSRQFPAGYNQYQFACDNLPAGLYYVRVEGGGADATLPMMKK